MVVAKLNSLNLELVDTKPREGVPDKYRKLNKLGKVPTFEGADGFVLSETIAINVYCKAIFFLIKTSAALDSARPTSPLALYMRGRLFIA